MKSKTSWKIKMDKPLAPEIKEGPEAWNHKYGGTKMLIPTPRLIESLLYQIPKGKIKTLSALREELAEECGADYACPLTTGIFLRICAEYAEELITGGQKKIPPYWRVVRDDGSFFEKFPGGEEQQMKKLQSEGHRIARIGKIRKRWALEL
ncbi:MAG: methylated DNA-protein cysteine methyltransferase [Saprospiraceae bacterium]|nr:methylated DNA-protein cysteine methyltransferase [Saprospiraceae bacterium]